MVDVWFATWPRKKPGSDRALRARLIAHRGAHHERFGIQENTDASFEQALQLGCWGIELDIHACSDGVLFINHDPTLRRLWGHNIKISETNFTQLRTVAPLMPTLEEVVVKYGKHMHLFIELKSPFTAVNVLVETLRPLTPCEDYHLISLDETILPILTPFPRESLLLIPVHNNVRKFCKLSLQESYGGVLGHHLLLSDKKAEKLHEANQIAGVGFVDSKYSLYRELNRGLEYLFSNNVRAVGSYLDELKKE